MTLREALSTVEAAMGGVTHVYECAPGLARAIWASVRHATPAHKSLAVSAASRLLWCLSKQRCPSQPPKLTPRAWSCLGCMPQLRIAGRGLSQKPLITSGITSSQADQMLCRRSSQRLSQRLSSRPPRVYLAVMGGRWLWQGPVRTSSRRPSWGRRVGRPG